MSLLATFATSLSRLACDRRHQSVVAAVLTINFNIGVGVATSVGNRYEHSGLQAGKDRAHLQEDRSSLMRREDARKGRKVEMNAAQDASTVKVEDVSVARQSDDKAGKPKIWTHKGGQKGGSAWSPMEERRRFVFPRRRSSRRRWRRRRYCSICYRHRRRRARRRRNYGTVRRRWVNRRRRRWRRRRYYVRRRRRWRRRRYSIWNGNQGKRGRPGYRGSRGDRGPRGYDGIEGYKGNHGTPGRKGQQGQRGSVGERGWAGPAGGKGPQGDPAPIRKPVDCRWLDWAQWAPCSKSCGGGNTRRERFPAVYPKDGGKGCDGLNLEVTACKEEACPTTSTTTKFVSTTTSTTTDVLKTKASAPDRGQGLLFVTMLTLQIFAHS